MRAQRADSREALLLRAGHGHQPCHGGSRRQGQSAAGRGRRIPPRRHRLRLGLQRVLRHARHHHGIPEQGAQPPQRRPHDDADGRGGAGLLDCLHPDVHVAKLGGDGAGAHARSEDVDAEDGGAVRVAHVEPRPREQDHHDAGGARRRHRAEFVAGGARKPHHRTLQRHLLRVGLAPVPRRRGGVERAAGGGGGRSVRRREESRCASGRARHDDKAEERR
mmetsp:Transcript_33533/g.84454  ORF Transcript_33533/g.84454 Transcript_33533/m.84454 type:complete len:220 (-) Transcript_33533:469-1128(-)